MRELLFGLNIDPRADRADMAVRLALLADERGLDLVSVMDHPEQPRFLETWTLLVALAMRTERVAVMPNVASVPLRPPAMLAKAASTLAILIGGRVILGVGAGDARVVRAFGGPSLHPREAVDALDEAVQVIRGL
jgi:alkanesulfonate monooxygenase SsuD/methylene tetrahydromethanopterin reductase-like flavin-dependent oxidoreductase (luciferase family)